MNPLERVHARPLPGFVSSRPALSPGFFISEQHRSTHMSQPPVPLSAFHRLWDLASGIRPFSTPEGQAFAQIGAGLDAARSLPLHSSAFRDHLLNLHLSRESYPPSSYALRRVIRDLEGQARNEASNDGPLPSITASPPPAAPSAKPPVNSRSPPPQLPHPLPNHSPSCNPSSASIPKISRKSATGCSPPPASCALSSIPKPLPSPPSPHRTPGPQRCPPLPRPRL